MRIAIFGTLSPLTERLSSANTGLATLLSWNKRISIIHLFAQEGAELPKSATAGKIIMKESWKIDSVSSLLRTLVHMWREKEVDLFMFNISLTMFGKKKLTNVVGLLLPVALSIATFKKAVVYMHDFVETDDPTKFGYRVNRLSRGLVSLLESFLIRSTHVVVPRPSQKSVLEKKYRRRIQSTLIPYVEGIQSLSSITDVEEHDQCAEKSMSDLTRFLLFGKWGPQKDLEGGLRLLSEVINSGHNVAITVAGSINPNFPEYEPKILDAIRLLPDDIITYKGNVLEDEVAELFGNSDILFLPYKSSGGYSGVLNLGALYGLQIIAYDVHELKEAAGLIGVDALFIDPADPNSVEKIGMAIEKNKTGRANPRSNVESKLEIAQKKVEEFVSMLEYCVRVSNKITINNSPNDQDITQENVV